MQTVIINGNRSNDRKIQKKNSTYAVKMNIDEFPYLGIWAKPGAPYVCLEPWQGLADYLDHNKNIEHKKGIILLPFGEEIEKIFIADSTILARSNNEIHLDPLFAPGGGNASWCLPFDQQAAFYFSVEAHCCLLSHFHHNC